MVIIIYLVKLHVIHKYSIPVSTIPFFQSFASSSQPSPISLLLLQLSQCLLMCFVELCFQNPRSKPHSHVSLPPFHCCFPHPFPLPSTFSQVSDSGKAPSTFSFSFMSLNSSANCLCTLVLDFLHLLNYLKPVVGINLFALVKFLPQIRHVERNFLHCNLLHLLEYSSNIYSCCKCHRFLWSMFPMDLRDSKNQTE